MAKTQIEWTDYTWNPVTGCTKISPGCLNCYAESMAKRLHGRYGYHDTDPFRVTLRPDRLEEPLGWKKPGRVFVCSMGDLFHKDVPDEFVRRVWNTMRRCPHLTFQVLTKRPERMYRYLTAPPSDEYLEEVKGIEGWGFNVEASPHPNIWLGVTCENSDVAFERIKILKNIPAAVRFISYEPALGPLFGVFMDPDTIGKFNIDWVIAGGESGGSARPPHPGWFRDVRDSCKFFGIPFMFKQWGTWSDQGPHELPRSKICWCGHNLDMKDDMLVRKVHDHTDCCNHARLDYWTVVHRHRSKKDSGRLLDGVEHNGYPEVGSE